MVYNLTKINGTSMLKMTESVNEVLMYNTYGILVIISIIIVTFSAFYTKTLNIKSSLTASLFIGFIISTFFRAINLVSDLVFYTTLILFGISMFLLFINKD